MNTITLAIFLTLTPILLVAFILLFRPKKCPPGLPPGYEMRKNDLGQYRIWIISDKCGYWTRGTHERARHDAWDLHWSAEHEAKRKFYTIYPIDGKKRDDDDLLD